MNVRFTPKSGHRSANASVSSSVNFLDQDQIVEDLCYYKLGPVLPRTRPRSWNPIPRTPSEVGAVIIQSSLWPLVGANRFCGKEFQQSRCSRLNINFLIPRFVYNNCSHDRTRRKGPVVVKGPDGLPGMRAGARGDRSPLPAAVVGRATGRLLRRARRQQPAARLCLFRGGAGPASAPWR
jgi:hypothetical protein